VGQLEKEPGTYPASRQSNGLKIIGKSVLYVKSEKEKKTPAKPPAWGIYNWAWRSRTPPAMREQIHDYAMKAIGEYLANMPEGKKVFTVMRAFPLEAWSDEIAEHLYRRYGEDKTFGVKMLGCIVFESLVEDSRDWRFVKQEQDLQNQGFETCLYFLEGEQESA
jgi:hypothetical protein